MDKQFSGSQRIEPTFGIWRNHGMENRISKRNVALVEKCVMSTIGIKGLFDAMPDCRHTLHIFSKPSTFYKAALKTPFSAVIFSLSALRTDAGQDYPV